MGFCFIYLDEDMLRIMTGDVFLTEHFDEKTLVNVLRHTDPFVHTRQFIVKSTLALHS